jgi:2-polyprenyl-3-methyl-5-hydroxy-6-metoxy-1,4-benzoquinol methylase
MFDAIKLKLYYDHALNTIKDEGEDTVIQEVTGQVVDSFIVPLKLKKTAKILDIGSGVGYFSDHMKDLGYTDITSTTWTEGDAAALEKKGHKYIRTDINFIKEPDSSYDFIFCRHSLEHSPFPYFALLEYNRLLKKGGKMYVEMPDPKGPRGVETWPQHYTVLGEVALQSLIARAGFKIEWYRNAQIGVTNNETNKVGQETYNCILANKIGNIEVK